MHKWVKNDPVRLFSCNIFVITTCFIFKFQVFLKSVFEIIPFRILTFFFNTFWEIVVFVLLLQVSISGSKMTRMHFLWNLMRTFDSYYLWLSGTYLLSNTKIVSEVSPLRKISVRCKIWYNYYLHFFSLRKYLTRWNWYNSTTWQYLCVWIVVSLCKKVCVFIMFGQTSLF